MTCLEHLIENTLNNMKRNSLNIMKDIKSDINLSESGITAEQCYEICQYIFYSYLPCMMENEENE